MVYLGDGRGDLCGVLHAVTRDTDLALPRKGYTLEGTWGGSSESSFAD